MRSWKIALGIAAALLTAACGDSVHPERALATAEELVTKTPAAVYAELDAALTKVEAASKAAKALTDDTREPITFAFEREPGKRLRLEAKARFRTVIIHVFVDPGPSPDETQLRAYFEKKSLREKGDSDYLSVALINLLEKIENDLETTGVVKTLFVFTPSPRGESGFAECSPSDCG